MAVVFISHKLDEVMEVADRITILRDGKKVGDFKSTELDEDAIVRHMTAGDVTTANTGGRAQMILCSWKFATSRKGAVRRQLPSEEG